MDPVNNPFMNRRKYTRLSKTLITYVARLSAPPTQAPAEKHWMASTVDISEGGVLLRSPERLRLGEGVEVLFELEHGAPPLKMTGNVVRYHAVMYERIYYVPVAFTAVSPAAREQLAKYMAVNASKN